MVAGLQDAWNVALFFLFFSEEIAPRIQLTMRDVLKRPCIIIHHDGWLASRGQCIISSPASNIHEKLGLQQICNPAREVFLEECGASYSRRAIWRLLRTAAVMSATSRFDTMDRPRLRAFFRFWYLPCKAISTRIHSNRFTPLHKHRPAQTLRQDHGWRKLPRSFTLKPA